MLEAITANRHRLLGTAAMAIAATPLLSLRPAASQPSNAKPATLPAIRPGTNTSFAWLKQIDAGLLNVGYAEAGPENGRAVILLHGWPYDIHSYVDVAPLLASAGYRVIVPYLRGYGTTYFLSDRAVRNGHRLCKNPRPVFGRIFGSDGAVGLYSGRPQAPTSPFSRSARDFPRGRRIGR